MHPHVIQRFEVLEHLGTGGMGTVYRARDPQLEREVAIKLLADPAQATAGLLSPNDTLDLRGGKASTGELLREARMMARLSHPNVLPVYEVGLVDGAVFVVMEYIAGTDLATWLATPRATEAIIDAFAQAGRGLAAAHARGVVHRDFKPANVLVGHDGRVRVADFGLSRLTAPTTALVRIDDGRGTPRYMAPELWRGGTATPRSDVFAFCTALAEALGDRAPPRVRAAITAGLADDPDQRCELATVLDALEGRAPHARRWLVAGAVAALAGGAALLASRAPAAPACAADPMAFAGVWDAGRRAELRRVLEPKRTPAIVDTAERILATLDAKQAAIGAELHATCVADLAPARRETRNGCLDRRIIDLGATVDYLLHAPWDLARANREVDVLGDPQTCATIDAPVHADRAAIAALHARLVAAPEPRDTDETAVNAFAAIESSALAIGDRELAAHATLDLGLAHARRGRIADATTAFRRARALAAQIRASDVAANALADEVRYRSWRGDQISDADLAELRALADRTDMTPATRGLVYGELGHVEQWRGHHDAAMALFQKGLEIASGSGRIAPVELTLRDYIIDSLTARAQLDAALAAAHELVDVAKAQLGEHDLLYAYALDTLANTYLAKHDTAEAMRVRREMLDILSATVPPDSAEMLLMRSRVADELSELGSFEDARKELLATLAGTEQTEAGRALQSYLHAQLANVLSDLGRDDEALAIARKAYDESVAQRGADDAFSLACLAERGYAELVVGKLDDAERDLVAATEAERKRQEPTVLAQLTGIQLAELALRRHDPQKAESLTRDALAMFDELHGDDGHVRADLHAKLGDALIAQHRYADARAALDKALAIAQASHVRADDLAVIDVKLAQVDAAEGHRAAAVARARRARAVLESFPGQRDVRDDADRVIAGK